MDTIIHRRREIIVAWAVAIIALFPAITGYSKYISYSTGSSALSGTESYQVQKILEKSQPQNSTLSVVTELGNNTSLAANKTLEFQKELLLERIPYLSSSESVFSAYASLINSFTLNYREEVISLSEKLNQSAFYVYGYATAFLEAWARYEYNTSAIFEASQIANNSFPASTAFTSVFLGLVQSWDKQNPVTLVQDSARMAALQTAPKQDTFYVALATKYLNITNYRYALTAAISEILSSATGQKISPEIVLSVIRSQDPGFYYVTHFGLKGVPGFIEQKYVSSDNSTQVIYVYFNVSETYRGNSNLYPAQEATPKIREIALKILGNNTLVTGEGAVAYDSQQLSSGSGFVFGLTFVFLAVAVAVTLGSLISPFLALLFVSISTALGYVSIFLTGLLFGQVDFTVTYTLTAVLLGVTTDYVIFLLSRYKEELKAGKSKDEALKKAVKRAGEAVVISGITVAGSLGSLSLLPDLRTWGPVLFFSVILTVLLVVSLLPSLTYFIGPRLFTKRAMARKDDSKGWIYRAASFSVRRKKIVAAVILASFVPSFFVWLTVPTTYNISEGLPQGLESVKAYSLLNQKFGSDVIFPLFVVAKLPSQLTFNNGSLSSSSTSLLNSLASKILSSGGIAKLVGPFSNSTSIPLTIATQFLLENGTKAYFLAFMKYDPYSTEALNTVQKLRNSGFLVGGLSASVLDLKNYYTSAFSELEIIIAFVIAVVLAISLKSAIFPVISLSGVMVSITWTTSMLLLISRYLLGQDIVFLVPVVLFVILMSLGNDFTVFILTRVKEEVSEKGLREGLLKAMSGSGNVVTSLGLILAVSLGSLAIVPFGFLEQAGIAFAISLVVDTFIIRTFYFPATISLLLKERNTAVNK